MFFGRKSKPDPAQVARQLRDAALSMKAASLGLSPSTGLPRVWGVLMETGFPDAVASLAVFADGTTSLYLSTGGGVIGAGAHETVRKASVEFLGSAESNLARLSIATATPLPRKGSVCFYVHTYEALLTAEADEQQLTLGQHPMSALFHAGQAVISTVRLSVGQTGRVGQQGDTKRQIDLLVRGIETLRRLASQRSTYRAPGPLDTVPAAVQEALDDAARELKEQAMTLLGDRMELQADGTALGPGRWFADGSATICGRLSALPSKSTGAITPLMMLFSEATSGEFFLTGRGAAGVSLASPPNLIREYIDWKDGLGRTLERHRAATARAASHGTLRRVEGIEEALDLLARLRKSGSDWRALQDADVLLDLDVRSVLGDRFDGLGPEVIGALTHGRR